MEQEMEALKVRVKEDADAEIAREARRREEEKNMLLLELGADRQKEMDRLRWQFTCQEDDLRKRSATSLCPADPVQRSHATPPPPPPPLTHRHSVTATRAPRPWVALCIAMLLGSGSRPPFQCPPPPSHRDASEGGVYPPPLQGAQPMPSHCLPDAKRQLQWHL